HILTNNHVIEGASSIRVSLADGRTFPGMLVGGDPQTDLAVIRVDGQDLPRAALGDSDRLQVGEWVVAIGHALGLSGGPTVTTGVVSALGRTVQEPGDGPGGGGGPFLFGVIQTDASINPGNSGGPLVNLGGEVVGLNTLGAGRAGPNGPQAEGISFAISINTARRIAGELIQNGRVAHPYLGIRYVALTPAVAAQLGIEGAPEGALLGEVVAGSPADRAGLRAEDVITKVEGDALRGESALAEAVDERRPGDTIAVTVLRDGQTTDLRVTLAETPR
ncbi:MAG: trypsin-like peptidase domain-containing protein, partial [Chloroflexi bacterium]|nr:trypsin-like peptidase domain-containing protein [Chloroflexota bacterium]